MTRSWSLVTATMFALVGCAWSAEGQSVQPCADATQCAHLTLSSATGLPDGSVQITLSFQQGPGDQQTGGLNAIGALALTLNLGDGTGTPLVLADCTPGANGLPNAIQAAPALGDFNVIAANTTCTGPWTSCLCPDPASGIAPDNFIDLAIFGPHPIPGSAPVDVPALPNGPLLTIDLKIASTAGGTIPLHVLTPWSDAQHPPRTAFLSIGDTLGVDQTCVPVSGAAPCSGAAPASQVVVTDGSVAVASPTTPINTPSETPTNTATDTATETPNDTPTDTATLTPTDTPTDTATPTPSGIPTSTSTLANTPTSTATPSAPQTPTETPTLPSTPAAGVCIGDCGGTHAVTVADITTLVNIVLGKEAPSACPHGIPAGGQVSVTLIIQAVNHALAGCP